MRFIMENTISLIELQSIITDFIIDDISSIMIYDIEDRETILFLPAPQTTGTNYQKLTYALKAADQIVLNLVSFEGMDDSMCITHFKDS